MTPQLPSRLPGASRAVATGLALAAVALGLAPSGPPVAFADSFESWPGVWTVGGPTTGNQIAALRPSADTASLARVVGPWDGAQALKVVYGGNASSNRAEAIALVGGPHQNAALRMMVYVPGRTAASMAAGQELQIARMMSLATSPGGDILLYLVRGSGAVFVRCVYTAGITGSISFGGAGTTEIAPDTWHTIEVTYREVLLATADLDLYIDDLSTPRAGAGGVASLLNRIGAVAVGLTGDVAQNSSPLVWWIDDVAVGPAHLGHGSPRLHFHQDGFESPGVSARASPAGKSLVASGAGSVKQSSTAGHRDGGIQIDDTDTTGQVVSAVHGELTGYDAGIGKVFHRVWWRQGTSAVIGGNIHPLTGIGGSSLGGVPPLDNPMAAISVTNNGTPVLWGYSVDGSGAPRRDPDVANAGVGPLDAGWHLLEVEVISAGAPSGSRRAWVDGQLLGTSAASWPGVEPTQWMDGHLPDPMNRDYVGSDDYDDSRTSLFTQASQFALGITGPLDAGACTPVLVRALDSNLGLAPPAEDVRLSYDAYGAGAFYADAMCQTASPVAAAITVPSGVTTVTAYFRPGLPGQARVTLGAPDYLSRDTTFSIIGSTVDDVPPTVPGQPFPFQLVTNSAVYVEWRGSRDDGGSGLDRYEVEASPNGGTWQPWTAVPAIQEGVDAGFPFDAGEAYWKLRVRAVDGAGNASIPGPESTTIAVDRTPPLRPSAPNGFLVTGGTSARAIWTAATDPVPVPTGIRSYVLRVVETPGGASVDYGQPETFRDFPVSPGNTYTMTVAASDNAGNISEISLPGTFVYPGPAAALRLLGLPPAGPDTAYAVAGVNYPVAVEAVDSAGNVSPGYGGTVVFRAVTEAGTPASASLPLGGGAYRFAPADQGRHGFDPGFTFNAPGVVIASVLDTANTLLASRVRVTVIDRGDVRIIHDANPLASDGVPYLYNPAGGVRAVSSDPLVFSSCDSPPSEFLVDRSSGAVRWIPSQGNNWPVDLCVRAEVAGGGASDEYRFSVSQLPASGRRRPVASFSAVPDSAGEGVPVLFDPTASSWDPGLSPPAYRWRFGDGSPLSFRPQPPHAYLLPGGYRPALTLFDAIGQSDQARREVRIHDRDGRAPPSLVIETPPLVGIDSLDASLQSTVTSGMAPAGTVHWDLGNGQFADGASVTASYRPGRTWATAMVVDGNGLPATDKLEIAVEDGDEVPPFCVAAVDPPVAVVPAGGRAQVTWVGWRSPGSREIASAAWNIDGVVTPAGSVAREYSTTGWRRGTLTVTDEDGLTCTDTVALLVIDPGTTPPGTSPPRILDPGLNGEISCAMDLYQGRPPLASGTLPLTWSISSPSQPGLTVDPGTGVVSWDPAVLTGVDRVSYTLAVQSSGQADQVQISIPYQCKTSADLRTRCGCGAGGGAPLLALALAAVRLLARRGRATASRRPGAPPS